MHCTIVATSTILVAPCTEYCFYFKALVPIRKIVLLKAK